MTAERRSDARPTVSVVQEVLPSYRLEFFEGLREYLGKQGLRLRLFHGNATAERASHNDEAYLGWAQQVRVWRPRVGRFRFTWIAAFRATSHDEIVIVEQANRHLLNYALLVRSRLFGGPVVAFWGHGEDMQGKLTGWGPKLKAAMIRLPYWWFAYTDGVRAKVIAQGARAERVTSVGNSAFVAAPDEAVVRSDRRLVFVGSLHRHKRVEFFLNAVSLLHTLDASVQVDCIGRGPEESLVVEFARQNGAWFKYHGRLAGRAKSSIVGSAGAMLNPGLVGLGVVDAFACQTPMITVAGQKHSPEFEYLVDGVNALILPAETDTVEFANSAYDLLSNSARLKQLRAGCASAAAKHGLDAMVRAFGDGVISAVAASSMERKDVR